VSSRIGLVVAGNDVKALRFIRQTTPEAWFLSPGIGVQGGHADVAYRAGARSDGRGILIATSRSITQSGNAEKAARTLRDSLRRARDAFVMKKDVVIAPPQEELSGFYSLACSTGTQEHTHIASSNAKNAMALKEEFVALLLATGCFKLGHFVLKSGITSPFYIDLRRLIADPKAMKIAAKAYGMLAASCTFDLIAGIPAAGLPLATVAALELNKPMIWPRMPLKEHGTGNRIEGNYAPNDRVLLLDDLITTGTSKREALELLRAEGLNC